MTAYDKAGIEIIDNIDESIVIDILSFFHKLPLTEVVKQTLSLELTSRYENISYSYIVCQSKQARGSGLVLCV